MVGRRRRVPWAGLRFVAAVIAMSGALLVLDAVLTIVWQEPVSALVATVEQGRLEDELQAEASLVAPPAPAPSPGDERRRLEELAALQARRTRTGQAIGRIELPTLSRSYAIVQGTDAAELRKGPGHYPDTSFPGQRGTTAVAGHRTTYLAPFRTIDRLHPTDEVVAVMPYGRFVYRVEETRIVPPKALWVKRRVAHDRLVLTACHPLYSAAQRIVVFARLQRWEPA